MKLKVSFIGPSGLLFLLLEAFFLASTPLLAWGEEEKAPEAGEGGSAKDEGGESGGSEPSPLGNGEVVVVTGTRSQKALGDGALPVTVLTREVIEASGAKSVAELLETAAGVAISHTFRGASASLQGLDPEHVLILVDGQRVTGRVGGAIDLNRFPLEAVEQVEILKGPASVLYGSDALGGVIHILTRKTTRPLEADLRARYGSRNGVDVGGSLGLSGRLFGHRLTLQWRREDGYDLDPSDEATTGSSRGEFHLRDQAQLTPREGVEVVLSGGGSIQDQKGVDVSASGAVFDRRSLTEEVSVSGGPRLSFGPKAHLEVTGRGFLYREQYLLDQRNSDALDSSEETWDMAGEVSAQVQGVPLPWMLVVAGAEVLLENMLSDRLGEGEGTRQRFGLFVEDEMEVKARGRTLLTVVPALRLDVDSRFGAHPTPKVALRFDPHPRLVVRASYGVGYRAPDFKEMLLHFENPSVGYVVEGNPDLRPETSHGVMGGVEWKAASGLTVGASGFYNEIKDLISAEMASQQEVPGNSVYQYVNIGAARTRGIEASLRWEPVAQVALSLGYDLTDTLDREEGRPLEGRALHRGNGSLCLSIPPWQVTFTARGRLEGPRLYFEDQDGDGEEETEIRSSPHALLDLRLEKRFSAAVELFIGVDNLLDAGEAEYLPLPPRAFYGGIALRQF